MRSTSSGSIEDAVPLHGEHQDEGIDDPEEDPDGPGDLALL